MTALIKVYDGSKYEAGSEVVYEKTYNDVNTFEVLSGKQFSTDVYDELDENDKYLRIYHADGSTQTFRNSHVDMLKL